MRGFQDEEVRGASGRVWDRGEVRGMSEEIVL